MARTPRADLTAMKWRFRIVHRLFLAFLALAGCVLAALAMTTQWRLNRDFLSYTNALQRTEVEALADQLAAGWPQEGSTPAPMPRHQWHQLWNTVSRQGQDDLFRPPRPPRAPPPAPANAPPRPRPAGPAPQPPEAGGTRPLRDRVSMVSPAGEHWAGPRPQQLRDTVTIDVMVDQSPAALLLWEPLEELQGSPAADLVSEQMRGALVTVAVLLALAVIAAGLVARHFARPITAIAQTSRSLTRQDYAARVRVRRSDEVGDLARAINQLARTLQSADAARRQSLADTAHELRTPLTVLQAQVEAMLDGVRAADTQGLAIMQRRIAELSALIDDLYTLAQSDVGSLRYSMESIDIGNLLTSVLEDYAPLARECGIQIQPPQPFAATIHGDARRLGQVFSNLCKNALAYTDAPGNLRVTVHTTPNDWQVVFADSAPGVKPEEIAQLTNVGFRGENARKTRQRGGGIGLAICERIVAGHGGSMDIAASNDGGLAVTVVLPRA